MKRESIVIEDVGPIFKLTIPVPANGGVVVLRGGNGTGKTSALKAADTLVNKRKGDPPPVRDGAETCSISGFGAILNVGRRMSHLGELEITKIDGLGLEDFVNPGLKDPEASDSKRIKALVTLSNVKPDPGAFYALLGSQEEFEKHVSSEALEGEDLITVTGAVKRQLEKASRNFNDTFEKAMKQYDAGRLSIGDTDLEAPDDEHVLSENFQKAGRKKQSLETAKSIYNKSLRRQREAREKLEYAKLSWPGKTIEQSREDYAACQTETQEARRKVSSLEEQLRQAKVFLDTCVAHEENEKTMLQQAEQIQLTMTAWQQTVDSTLPDPVNEEDLEEADKELNLTKSAMENGVLVRKAKADLVRAEEFKTAALKAQTESIRLRDAAHATEQVLSHAIEGLGVPLKVHNNRLYVTKTDRAAGMELFDELSEGERWAAAGDIGVSIVGPGGLIILKQEGWQAMDEKHRRIFAQRIENTKVVVLTGEQDSSYPELTPQQYDPFELE